MVDTVSTVYPKAVVKKAKAMRIRMFWCLILFVYDFNFIKLKLNYLIMFLIKNEGRLHQQRISLQDEGKR
jgi:hypothetical protein